MGDAQKLNKCQANSCLNPTNEHGAFCHAHWDMLEPWQRADIVYFNKIRRKDLRDRAIEESAKVIILRVARG